ncbi:DUF397 domain-containing protein [Amycolatopsis sp. CA-230715]|uniref:DUF397 domain-containing protein n=1 Tax=Amycolatopsis sp. CA-230715 TaxID=2745196 RepID=UPI001C037751|nr:DUF397 domain-containing protein [Amycolatopsis sp. CA-230715]QWF76679.1 hypothetical protein HUW46_00055 [Amycolatopsis sp. CA-230715]
MKNKVPPPRWRTSSYSGQQGDCVEVKLDTAIGVRDTKDRTGGDLDLHPSAWNALLTRLR